MNCLSEKQINKGRPLTNSEKKKKIPEASGRTVAAIEPSGVPVSERERERGHSFISFPFWTDKSKVLS